jgi:hypothetical protein
MTLRPSYVSVIDPIAPAIERVKTVLFRPFDLGRWFVIGFCAWLAQLGKSGGPGGGGGGGGHGRSWQAPDLPGEIRRSADQARDFVFNNLEWLIPVALVVFVLIIGLWLLVIWLSSRGRFMFLDCVAQNKAEVVNPWRRLRPHGNSLFGFRVALGLTGLAVAILFLMLAGLVAFAAHTGFGFNFFSITGILCCSLLFVATIIVFSVAALFTKDFAVPIMYRQTSSSVAAWRLLLEVLAVNKARFFLYLLFQIVINIAVGVLVMAAACLTCCLACCLFMLPYIGTVALLPVHVFTRSYSLYYLAQYGPELNVFEPQPGQSITSGGPPA